MNNIKRICQEVIAAGEKEQLGDYNYLSFKHADKLARALLVMEEALGLYQHLKLPTIRDGWVSYSDCYIAKEALAKAEQILGDIHE